MKSSEEITDGKISNNKIKNLQQQPNFQLGDRVIFV